jgi:hypothetical protein
MPGQPQLPLQELTAVQRSIARAEEKLFSKVLRYFNSDFRLEDILRRGDMGVSAVFPFFGTYAERVVDACGCELLKADLQNPRRCVDRLKAKIPRIVNGVLPFPLDAVPSTEQFAHLAPRGLWENCHPICWNASKHGAGGTLGPFYRALRNGLLAREFAGRLKGIVVVRTVYWKRRFIESALV